MYTIAHIDPPYIFTECGKRFMIKQVTGGTPRKGVILDENLVVKGSSADSDCVGGQCPIK